MGIYRIANFDPRAIAASGQCFRMLETAPGQVEVTALHRHLVITCLGGDSFEFSCPDEEFQAVWQPYFDLDADYGAYLSAVDETDAYLLQAAHLGQGLRILRQDPWETLISFILSQRKSIPAIRDSIEKLCRHLGEPISNKGRPLYAFPAPSAIANAPQEALKACSVGYRGPYIQATAQAIARGEIDLNTLSGLQDGALRDSLLSFSGVGVKVAHCVMLFGYHRLSSAPVDVWIQRVIDLYYGGASPFDRYPGIAGVMQQYMFYERMLKKRGLSGPAA
jgi:N-glycosylase/DNA lyase